MLKENKKKEKLEQRKAEKLAAEKARLQEKENEKGKPPAKYGVWRWAFKLNSINYLQSLHT